MVAQQSPKLLVVVQIYQDVPKKERKEKMSKVRELSGQRFGRLIVIERKNNDKKGNSRWLCKCDCGRTKIILGSSLKSGLTKSCGCLRKEIIKTNIKLGKCGTLKKDMSGLKIGKLTVLKEYKSTGKTLYWKCQCECGNKIFVQVGHLKRKETLSCGCLKQSKGELKIEQILKKNHIKFEKQKTFESCRFKDTNWLAKFDFWINDTYLLEYDGDLHYFSKNSGWNNQKLLEKTKEHDKYKNKWCKENKIPLIRIPYTIYDSLSIEDILLEKSKYII